MERLITSEPTCTGFTPSKNWREDDPRWSSFACEKVHRRHFKHINSTVSHNAGMCLGFTSHCRLTFSQQLHFMHIHHQPQSYIRRQQENWQVHSNHRGPTLYVYECLFFYSRQCIFLDNCVTKHAVRNCKNSKMRLCFLFKTCFRKNSIKFGATTLVSAAKK